MVGGEVVGGDELIQRTLRQGRQKGGRDDGDWGHTETDQSRKGGETQHKSSGHV